LWLVRFRVLSTGVHGEAAYRLLYLGAKAGAPGAPTTYFGGSTTCADATCTSVSYPASVPATGSVDGTTVTVRAALNGGFGASVPLNGDLLYDVVGISLVGGADADSTAPFDYKLDERIGRTTGKGRHI